MLNSSDILIHRDGSLSARSTGALLLVQAVVRGPWSASLPMEVGLEGWSEGAEANSGFRTFVFQPQCPCSGTRPVQPGQRKQPGLVAICNPEHPCQGPQLATSQEAGHRA